MFGLFVLVGLLAGAVFNVADIHRNVDLKRCYTEPVAFEKVCWPKRGCWLDESGVAQCWQVQTIKQRKTR